MTTRMDDDEGDAATPKTANGRGLRLRGKIWWIRYCRNGKRFEESSRSTKKGVALRQLRLREGAVAQGRVVTPAMGRKTVDKILDDLITEQKANGRKSAEHVKRRVDLHVRPYFGYMRCGEVTTATVNAYIADRLEAGAKPATINRELAALKRAFRLARRASLIMDTPYIPMLREANARQGFLEPEQLAKVIDHLPPYVRPVIEFAAITGWRIQSEVMPLQWKQVDLKAGEVRLEPDTTKNSEGRTFVLGPLRTLREVLEQQWAEHEALKKRGVICPWVFHRNGKRIKIIKHCWDTACKLAGCPGRIPHDLRRTAIRAMIRAGISEHTAMMMSGHKTASVFRRYAIVSTQDLAEAAAKLAAASGQ